MSGITEGISKLKPFGKKRSKDDEDAGEKVDKGSVAGGGHSYHDPTKSQLRVSPALRAFLVHEKVLSEQDAGVASPDTNTEGLKSLLARPHISVPASVLDRSHPLPEYFVSSSHNTYLMAHQLYGNTSAEAYEIALKAGSRCVEIDAWDDDVNKDEPKVTHGFTLVSHISFRAVCETIRDLVDSEASGDNTAAPILLSLENHCDAHGQMRLAKIMKEVFGHRLLTAPVRRKGHAEEEGVAAVEKLGFMEKMQGMVKGALGDKDGAEGHQILAEADTPGQHVRLSDLGNKVAVIVEYHLPNEPESSDSGSSSESSSDEDESIAKEQQKMAKKKYKDQKKTTPATGVIPELADLGVYAQSVKPGDNTWYESDQLKNGPHHHLINVSESGLTSHMPKRNSRIAQHNAQHLMRVYPKGTRISSHNLKPVKYWGVGAQICALNWQTFGASMQLNEALFSGSDGFVLKPAPLRAGGSGKLSTGRKKKLCLSIGEGDGRASAQRPLGERHQALRDVHALPPGGR